MTVLIASDQQCPGLSAALAARGLTLGAIGMAGAEALLLDAGGMPRIAVARTRNAGWTRPLMLLVETPDQIAEALDAGADEAAMHSTPPAENAARLAARMRGRYGAVRIGDLMIDPVAQAAMLGPRRLRLRRREYALLAHLAAHPGCPVPRRDLLRAIWDMDFDPGTNVVQVHVSRLRAELQSGGEAPMLHTDRGRGYRLGPPGPAIQPIF